MLDGTLLAAAVMPWQSDAMTDSSNSEPRSAPRISFVSLGCPNALVDSERILTQLRAEGYELSRSHAGRRQTLKLSMRHAEGPILGVIRSSIWDQIRLFRQSVNVPVNRRGIRTPFSG